jgi:hypothetical protein
MPLYVSLPPGWARIFLAAPGKFTYFEGNPHNLLEHAEEAVAEAKAPVGLIKDSVCQVMEQAEMKAMAGMDMANSTIHAPATMAAAGCRPDGLTIAI